jgi:hypothetical protein
VELRIARSAAAAVLVLSVPVVGIAALAVGREGAIGAAVGAGVVLGMFVLAGGLVTLAAPFGPSAILAATLGGFALRLVLYAVLMVVLTPIEAIHGPSLAIAAAVLLLSALAWEARHVSRIPDFFWVRTEERPSERTSA